jgi:hypothetical protein
MKRSYPVPRDSVSNPSPSIPSHWRSLAAMVATLFALPLSAQANGPEDIFYGPMPNWVSVAQFGANGADNVDDTVAIQRAIDALIRQAEGVACGGRSSLCCPPSQTPCTPWATLYFPAGTYYIRGLNTHAQTAPDPEGKRLAVQGINLIGEDPTTTKFVYVGEAGGVMLNWNASYDKVARLSFEGESSDQVVFPNGAPANRGKAAKGIYRENHRYFSTNSEMSDLSFSGIAAECLQLGSGFGGVAEISILRSRFYDCGRGIRLYDFNTLDVYIWNSFFKDNGIAVDGETGAFHAYDNQFWGSKSADFRANAFISTMTQNTSLNAYRFLKGTNSNPTMMRNQVFNPIKMPIFIAGPDDDPGFGGQDLYVNGLTMIDNTFKLRPGQHLLELRGAGHEGHARAASLLSGNQIDTDVAWPVRPHVIADTHQFANHPLDAYVAEKARDNDPDTFTVTNFRNHNKGGVQWFAPFGTKPKVDTYRILRARNGNWSAYAPTELKLYGSNDWGATWTLLDSRSLPAQDHLQLPDPQDFTFQVAANKQGNYAIYEIRLSRSNPLVGDYNIVPLAEFKLWEMGVNGLHEIQNHPQSYVNAPRAGLGKFAMDTEYLYPIGTWTAPESLEPYPFQTRDFSGSFIEPQPSTGSVCPDGAAIQTAINTATTSGAPGVYLRKCAYSLTQPIEIPANFYKVLMGEGANASTTTLRATSGICKRPSNSDPSAIVLPPVNDNPALIRVSGDAPAVLRDFYLDATQSSNCADAIAVVGGGNPIAMDQVVAGGGNGMAGAVFRVETARPVNMRSIGMGNHDRGVVANNGSKVQVLSGGTGNGTRSYEANGAESSILGYGIWQDDTHPSTPYQQPLLDLSSSRGTVSLVANAFNVSFDPLNAYQGKSIVGSNFAGRLSLIGNRFSACGSFDVGISGDAFQTFAAAQSVQYGAPCDRNPQWNVQAMNPSMPYFGGGAQVGVQELPQGQNYRTAEDPAASLQPCVEAAAPLSSCVGTMPNDVNGQPYAYPAAGTFVTALEHLRTLNLTAPESKDLRLSRLYISIAQGKDGVVVRQ